MRKLFLDDLRTVDMVYSTAEATGFDVVRSYDDFVSYIKRNGLPDFISFDNDLGLDASEELLQMDMPVRNGLFTNLVLT